MPLDLFNLEDSIKSEIRKKYEMTNLQVWVGSQKYKYHKTIENFQKRNSTDIYISLLHGPFKIWSKICFKSYKLKTLSIEILDKKRTTEVVFTRNLAWGRIQKEKTRSTKNAVFCTPRLRTSFFVNRHKEAAGLPDFSTANQISENS